MHVRLKQYSCNVLSTTHYHQLNIIASWLFKYPMRPHGLVIRLIIWASVCHLLLLYDCLQAGAANLPALNVSPNRVMLFGPELCIFK